MNADGLVPSQPASQTSVLPALGLRFAITYALIAAALFSIYGFPFELFGARQDWLSGYLALYAHLAGGVLHWLDPAVVVSENRIDGRFALQIVRNCDAIDVNILYLSAVLAFPAPLARRFAALVGGLTVLILANIGRICLLYFVGVYQPTWFTVAHEEILPLVLIALTAGTFLAWARYLSHTWAAAPAE